jgi:hypothetical protein
MPDTGHANECHQPQRASPATASPGATPQLCGAQRAWRPLRPRADALRRGLRGTGARERSLGWGGWVLEECNLLFRFGLTHRDRRALGLLLRRQQAQSLRYAPTATFRQASRPQKGADPQQAGL